jgi:hypothetical protein
MAGEMTWTGDVNGNNPTIMGWNQRVVAKRGTTGDVKILKVKSFSVGITQNYDVPDLVTGATDRITWSKGTIDLRGSIEAPMTQSFTDMVLVAADYASIDPSEAVMQVYSDIHGGPYACMVNTVTITANEKEPVQITAEFIGRLGVNLHSNSTGTDSVVMSDSAGTVDGYLTQSAGSLGTPDPLDVEQIVMFDRVALGTGMNPGTQGCTSLLPIGFTLTMDNKLQQNYILGCGGNWSSLDAWSISAGQRLISGTVRFQSGSNGTIQYVKNVGTTGGDAGAGDLININDMIVVDGTEFMVLWGAKPPSLGVDKVIVELTFTLIARTPGLHRITA